LSGQTLQIFVIAELVSLAAALLTCLLKGKYLMSFLLIICPVGWVVGAVRIAKPNSVWARMFYTGPKAQLAHERFPYIAEEANLRKEVRDQDNQAIIEAWDGIKIDDPDELDAITRRALRRAGRI